MGKGNQPYMDSMVSNCHYDGRHLVPWKIMVTEIRKDSNGVEFTVEVEKKRKEGHLIVMRTNGFGQRTLIEQPGHPVPQELANNIGAKIRHLKVKEAA